MLWEWRAACLEVRVLVKYRTIGANVAGGVVLLLAGGSDTTCTKSGRSRANQLGKTPRGLVLLRVSE